MNGQLPTQSGQTVMKKMLTLFAVLLIGTPATMAAEIGGLDSLRTDDISLEAPAAPLKKQAIEDTVLDRQFVQQPPLIPHTVRDYQVDKNVNKCLSCHSWKNAKKWGATRISITHFNDRDDKQLADVSPRRYFCLQCHVVQADANVLVENTFKPVDSLGH